MTVYDLNRDQLQQLKQQYYLDRHGNADYYTLANIDKFVSDREICNWWDGTEFSPDDFMSDDSEQYSEFGWIGKADDINKILRDLNHVVDRIIDKVRTDERYAELYDSLAMANNELVLARLQAQDIETGH